MKGNELRIGNYMIQVNELRVGNLFFDIIMNGLCQVSTINHDGWIRFFSHYNGDIIAEKLPNSDNVQAINLNTEWMNRFGFELFPWGYVKNEVLIRYSFNNNSTAKFWLEVGNGLRVELEFVHQLQNLFFAITNKELLIS